MPALSDSTRLHVRLPAIIVLAQHLTVRGDRLAALTPRRDVIGFHPVDLEVLAALHAKALLPLVRFSFVIVAERPDAEVTFLAGE